MQQKIPEGEGLVVEYVVGNKLVARVKYGTERQFVLSEKIRKEYIRIVGKPTWNGFMKYLGVAGVSFEHDKPDKVVGFMDIR